MLPDGYYSIEKYHDGLADSRCCICLEDLTPLDMLISHQGKHTLHEKCAETSNSCPMCRAPIFFTLKSKVSPIVLSQKIEKGVFLLTFSQIALNILAGIITYNQTYNQSIGKMDCFFPN